MPAAGAGRYNRTLLKYTRSGMSALYALPKRVLRRTLPLLIAVACLSGGASAANGTDAVNPAQRMVSLSVHEDVPATDARVVAAGNTLGKLAKLTGEDTMALAAACTRYSHYLFDAAKMKAPPLEVLDALDRLATKGVPINDTLQRYVTARLATPGKSHGEVLATLQRK